MIYERIKNQLIACDKDDSGTGDNGFSYDYTDFNGTTHVGVTKSAKTIAKELDELRKTTVSRSDYASDAAYNAAITAQRERVASMEAQLEARINAAVSRLNNKRIKYSTGAAGADKVIREQFAAMVDIKNASNDLGKSLDRHYATVSASDAVGMWKQGKNIAAQATSGKIQTLADAGKYTNSGKK